MSERHRLEIEFCAVCKFQGRAFFLARELYDQRPDLFDEIALLPVSGGAFNVSYDGALVWDYRAQGGFPDPKTIREAILDATGQRATPERHLRP